MFFVILISVIEHRMEFNESIIIPWYSQLFLVIVIFYPFSLINNSLLIIGQYRKILLAFSYSSRNLYMKSKFFNSNLFRFAIHKMRLNFVCERVIAGNLPWWLQLEGDLLIIVIIVAMVILLAIIICSVVIWLICRRKRSQAKCKYPVCSLSL